MTIMLKTGKLAATDDPRTLRLRDFIRATPSLPKTFSVDVAFPGCRNHMYGNDDLGDCVIAGQFEAQDRITLRQTGKPSGATDEEAKDQYFKESGDVDSGLNLLSAMKWWKKKGIRAGRVNRKIDGFLSVDWTNPREIQTAIVGRMLLVTGVQLPDDAMTAFIHGKQWTATKRPPDEEGGHCIVTSGYDQEGVTFITWNAYIHASYAWLKKYGDEMFAPVFTIRRLRSPILDLRKFQERLAQVA